MPLQHADEEDWLELLAGWAVFVVERATSISAAVRKRRNWSERMLLLHGKDGCTQDDFDRARKLATELLIRNQQIDAAQQAQKQAQDDGYGLKTVPPKPGPCVSASFAFRQELLKRLSFARWRPNEPCVPLRDATDDMKTCVHCSA